MLTSNGYHNAEVRRFVIENRTRQRMAWKRDRWLAEQNALSLVFDQPSDGDNFLKTVEDDISYVYNRNRVIKELAWDEIDRLGLRPSGDKE